MRASLLAIATASVLFAGGAAHAQRVSPLKAGRFLQICSSPNGAGVCDAYIAGMTDAGALAHVDGEHDGDKARAEFCVPKTQNGPQMRGLVVAWMRAHPQVMDKPVGESVFAALHDSYPCHEAPK